MSTEIKKSQDDLDKAENYLKIMLAGFPPKAQEILWSAIINYAEKFSALDAAFVFNEQKKIIELMCKEYQND
jgi:hypothetical protein